MHAVPERAKGRVGNNAGALIRRLALELATVTVSPLVFRLSIGRWPSWIENRRFASAMCGTGARIPAIPRALIVTPAARSLLAHMLTFYLMNEGLLPKTEEGGIVPRSGNPLAFWRNRPVTFLHFERTAGTTLAALLTEKFHPLQIATAPLPFDAPDTSGLLDSIDDHKLVWGHYDLPCFQRLGTNRHIITLLREPSARIVSLYYFWRSIHSSQLKTFDDSRVLQAQSLSLLDFLQSDHPPLRDSIDNVYVRRLAGLNGGGTPDDPLARDPDRALQTALAALEQLSFVGIVERMGKTLAGLEAVLGTQLSGPALLLNDTAGNPTNHPAIYRNLEREEMTPAIQSALAHLTRLDRLIYNTCLERLLSAEKIAEH